MLFQKQSKTVFTVSKNCGVQRRTLKGARVVREGFLEKMSLRLNLEG